MSRSYQQYLRAYANVLSDGLVKCDLMTSEGFDVLAIALGVLHAKRAICRPERECPMTEVEFSSESSRLTSDAAPVTAC